MTFFSEQNLQKLLAFSPMLFFTTSAAVGINMGLIVIAALILGSLIIYSIRSFISLEHIPFVIIIICSFLATIIEMFVLTFSYLFAEKLGYFFILLIINGLVFCQFNNAFTKNSIKSFINELILSSVLILFFFVFFGLIREIVSSFLLFSELNVLIIPYKFNFNGFELINNNISFQLMNFPAGCFLLMGVIFALINFLRVVISKYVGKVKP